MQRLIQHSYVCALALLLLPSNHAVAKLVTKATAQQIAQAFLQKEQTAPPRVATKTKGEFIVRDQAAGLTLGSIQTIKSDDGQVLAYVLDLEPQGFIITSADDNMRSILGFSFDSKFLIDGNSANPLLDLIKADVLARKGSSSASSHESVDFGSATEYGPWLNTEWHQTRHWNNKCPYIVENVAGSRRPVGCVATALGQIVKYWEYPKSIGFSSTNDSYSSGDIDIFGDAGNYGFPTVAELNSSLQDILYNGNQAEEANLSFGLGVKLQMNYGTRGSGANTFNVRNVLDTELGFGSVVAYTDREGVWSTHVQGIIEDLKNAWPIQIGIHQFGERSGHSIVVDGYRDTDNFFHLNYGWGATSPDPIGSVWYNMPTNMPHFNVVHTVIYGIAKYQGWNQAGADQRNSYCAIYPAPIVLPERKWTVGEPPGLPITNRFSQLVIGRGGRIYASTRPIIQGDIYHPHIAIYDKFGTLEKVIEIPNSNHDITFLCQNSRGEVFFSTGQTSTDSRLIRLNPGSDEITTILTHTIPDDGGFDGAIKVDRDDYLYFVIQPRFTANFGKFYCIDRTGVNRWAPFSFPTTAEFALTQPAIDEDRDRVYLNYFDKTGSFLGNAHLIAFKLSTGAMVFDVILPNIPTHFAGGSAGPPSVGKDGTVYIGAYTSLYAYSSDGVKQWEQSFFPYFTNQTPAISPGDGKLYVNYGEEISGTLFPGYVRALNATNGTQIWEHTLPLGESDDMGEIYCAANGMVIYSYTKSGEVRLGGVKDEGSTAGISWDMAGGGELAFGPGRTVYALQINSISAWTDLGDRGDPEGKGGDFADNRQPSINTSPIFPADGAVDVDTASVQLSWTGTDPDGHCLTYDVFISALVNGEEAAFVPVASDTSVTSITLSGLKAGTQYAWSVVATDGQAFSKESAWTFSTVAQPVDNVYLTIEASDVHEGVRDGSFPLNVWVSLSETIDSGTLGFTWNDTTNWRIDSVNFGPAISSWESLGPIDTALVNAAAKVLIGGAATINKTNPGLDQLWATIYFSLKSGNSWTVGSVMKVDSVFVPPSGAFVFVQTDGDISRPTFTGVQKVTFTDVSVDETSAAKPTSFSLSQNYPNPFNPSTKILINLPVSSEWEILIYNIQGQKIDSYSAYSERGVVTIEWDGSNYASGVYFYKLTAGEFAETKKMVLLK